MNSALRSPSYPAPAGIESLETGLPWSALTNVRFAELPPAFIQRVLPTPLPAPHPIAFSDEVAQALGVEQAVLARASTQQVLAGAAIERGAQPFATVYAGHQFGVWAGRLGDGRALHLGEMVAADGSIQEIQLKGAGLTPFSRMGDGRAVLRSSIREFLASEAMAGLGIPTTRALSLMGSGAPVWRETLETAAVVARVAPSFIRFGHFEYFAHFGQHDHLRRLVDWVIKHWFGSLHSRQLTPAQRATELLRAVCERTGRLIAAWQSVGFCHGVLNTDNMSILGLTIDYGPYGFLDAFDVHHVCNHSDTAGRYAYAEQPAIGEWNCIALAQALMPCIGDIEAARDALTAYATAFDLSYDERMRAKLGLRTARPEDRQLVQEVLALLHDNGVDFTRFFRALCDLPTTVSPAGDGRSHGEDGFVRDMVIDRQRLDAWLSGWRARLVVEGAADPARQNEMRRCNPAIVLRNHLLETAIRNASSPQVRTPLQAERVEIGDFGEVNRLLQAFRNPYDEPKNASDAREPPDWARSLEVSCSS